MMSRSKTIIRRLVSSSQGARLLSPRVQAFCTSSAFRSKTSCISDNPDSADELFNYTSGRFMFNEALRLKERHVIFDVNALKLAAEAALDSEHGRVTGISKLGEGGFNRVFLLQMEDGFEMVAKVPYHISVPRYFATASEVATLEFLRLQNIPVPEVYGYSATHDNPVGSEYILMQKASGVSLTAKWNDLSTIQIKRVTHSFMEVEKKLFDLPFGATGSIYFKKDLASDLQTPIFSRNHGRDEQLDRFCIGPIADHMFWYGRRAGLQLERGPWKNPVEYLRSTADKEIEWTKCFGKDRDPSFPHNTMEMGRQSAKSYIDLLEKYKLLTPHLLPKNHADLLASPTLRHPDLSPSNIFISPETGWLSCLIDWQHAVLQPRLLAAGYPRAFENPDTEEPVGVMEPSLPKDFDTLSPETKAEVEGIYRRLALFHFYRIFNGAYNRAHLAALNDPLLKLRQHLVDRASRQWHGNLVTLKGAIMRMTQFWEKLPDVKGVECPVHFEQSDVDSFLATEAEWLKMSFAEENWRQQVCFMNEDGWVRNEEFDEASAKLRDLADLVWSICDDDEDKALFMATWPFKDHEEED